MSQQVNFFTAPEDAAAFHSWLLMTFPDWAIVFDDSARYQRAGGVPQPITPELLGTETVNLIPAWAIDRLVYSGPGSMVSLNVVDSPVLQYTPCVVEADKGCVKVGRIYWAYRGELKRAEKNQIGMIFRWIQTRTQLIPKCGTWRISLLARRFHLLRPWVGDPKPNPLYRESDE